MKFDKYIKDLLYRNDCVVLPNLGAFRVLCVVVESPTDFFENWVSEAYVFPL